MKRGRPPIGEPIKLSVQSHVAEGLTTLAASAGIARSAYCRLLIEAWADSHAFNLNPPTGALPPVGPDQTSIKVTLDQITLAEVRRAASYRPGGAVAATIRYVLTAVVELHPTVGN